MNREVVGGVTQPFGVLLSPLFCARLCAGHWDMEVSSTVSPSGAVQPPCGRGTRNPTVTTWAKCCSSAVSRRDRLPSRTRPRPWFKVLRVPSFCEDVFRVCCVPGPENQTDAIQDRTGQRALSNTQDVGWEDAPGRRGRLGTR